MSSRIFLALAASCALAIAVPAAAQHEGHGGGRGQYLDARHGHNQYYPNRGLAVREVPRGAVALEHRGGRYWYGGGVWYAPRGPRWFVVAPPIGVYVPILPPFYTTVWFGGMPYYYANDAYYVWRDGERGYEVVEPPADVAPSNEMPVSEEVYMYPRAGQSPEQQAKDRYECHRWAADQTGFDPTQAAGGVAAGEAQRKRGEYHRAMSACLEGRGYSVK
jgi:hypothetical protein